jgi:hypothetical protein
MNAFYHSMFFLRKKWIAELNFIRIFAPEFRREFRPVMRRSICIGPTSKVRQILTEGQLY